MLQLEEAAEDWADAAAVPVDLVLALGRARFGVEAGARCPGHPGLVGHFCAVAACSL